MLERRVRHKVPSELLSREFVEGLVRVEGANHVVAVRVNVYSDVAVKPDRIRVPHQIEPMHGHALSIVIGVEQLVDESIKGVRTRIAFKGGDQLGGRREAGKVEARATRQRPPIRLARGLETGCLQALGHQVIDRG